MQKKWSESTKVAPEGNLMNVTADELEKEMGAMANGEGIRIGWGALITLMVILLSGVIGYNYSQDGDMQREIKGINKEKLDRNEYYLNHKDLENELKVWAKELSVSVKEMAMQHQIQMTELQKVFIDHMREEKVEPNHKKGG